MMQIICYLFPSVIAVWITENLMRKSFSEKEWGYYFCGYVISINFVISLLLTTVFSGAETYLSISHFTHSLITKYLSFSIILSIILPMVFILLKHNFNFEFKVEKIETKVVKELKNETRKKTRTRAKQTSKIKK